jgi:hypothetical protein
MSQLEPEHPDFDELIDLVHGKSVDPALAWHAHNCSDCRRTLEIVRLLRTPGPEDLPPVPEETVERWMRAVTEAMEKRELRRRRRQQRWRQQEALRKKRPRQTGPLGGWDVSDYTKSRARDD